MSGTAYRAWSFLHPDLEATDEVAGLSINPRGRIEMVEENASVRQAILILLTTAPGERVMRPDYGCNLRKLVFSPNDDTTAGLALHFIRRALARWEPRIHVIHLDAGPNPIDPSRLELELEYRARATRRTDQIKRSLSLAGEGT